MSHTPTMNGLDGQQKFTRYKSVRQTSKASASEHDYHHPLPDTTPTQANGQGAGVSRSMSRYKRPRAQTAGGSANEMPAVPKIPQSHHVQTSQQTMGQQNGQQTTSKGRYRNTSAPAAHSAAQLPNRPRMRTSSSGNMSSQEAQHGTQTSARQSRRGTQSSRGQTPAVPAMPVQQNVVYVDPYGQMSQTQLNQVQMAPVQMSQTQMYNGQTAVYTQQGPTFITQETEEARVRRMLEADKERQKRLRAEQKQREAQLAAEKAEKQRQAEEEERKKEEEITRKAEEKRMMKEKLEEARRQHAERKKQQSRGLFSRGGTSRDDPRRSSENGTKYGGREEIVSPANDEHELPTRQVDAKVIARPYQSPPKVRKESISQPMSSAGQPQSPPKVRNESISQPVNTGMPRPSISQRPADVFFDAPKSTANASERSVIVCYGEIKSVITVDSNTIVEDLLRSAAKEMPQAGIDPLNDVLMECFSQQEHRGLERRMRRYEIVQKVMDSWDFDRQNKLSVIKGNIGGTDGDLLLSAVSRRGEPKTSTFVRLHYSSANPNARPTWGTFEKPQMCILRPDGQILVGKSDDERSAAAACHMADFEIFIPTPEQMKRIKAKGKKSYVFAIKSQNKAAVYAESNNYVHYFSTRDRADADRWYMAVQNWRSWYMVERLGYGKPPEESSGGWIGKLSIEQSRDAGTRAGAGKGPTLLGGLGNFMEEGGKNSDDIFTSIMNKYDSSSGPKKGAKADGDNLDLSKETLGYDLGGLISRIPMNEHSYDERPQQMQSSGQRAPGAAGAKTFDRRGGPPTSFPAAMVDTNREEPFAAGGLLGRSYSQRKAQQEITGRSSLDQSNGPKKSGPVMDWGRPLVDFKTESNPASNSTGPANAGVNARKAQEGPLIGRI